MPLQLRPLRPQDSAAAARLFFDAVHQGAADVYSEQERIAWAGHKPDPHVWQGRFDGVNGVVAERDGVMLGFMTLDDGGSIDLAFVAPDVMGQGVGRLLYEAIERQARAWGIRRLTTQASLKAKPFFARMGWQVDRPQSVMRRGTALCNFWMSKTL
ncbi:MAG: GNAT family N-acetyltransferase [Rhodobacterales bacterium]|nr:MAG: GNAT family N-acetyltransferase [Rhodobacterales bacterium]